MSRPYTPPEQSSLFAEGGGGTGKEVLEGGEGGGSESGGGEGGWLGHPSYLGTPMVPAKGGPKIVKLKSSWRRRKSWLSPSNIGRVRPF